MFFEFNTPSSESFKGNRCFTGQGSEVRGIGCNQLLENRVFLFECPGPVIVAVRVSQVLESSRRVGLAHGKLITTAFSKVLMGSEPTAMSKPLPQPLGAGRGPILMLHDV
jgi:hypothetical protein